MAEAARNIPTGCKPDAWVRLDQINIRRSIELSPRDCGTYQGGRGALITEYVRGLISARQAGVVLPPVRVHRPSMCLADGINRYLAEKQLGADGWESQKIGVVWDADCPDPEANPLAFTLYAAALNATNGLPLNLGERKNLLKRAVETNDESVFHAAAKALCLTLEQASAYIAEMAALGVRTGSAYLRAAASPRPASTTPPSVKGAVRPAADAGGAVASSAVGEAASPATGARGDAVAPRLLASPSAGMHEEPLDPARQVQPHLFQGHAPRGQRGLQSFLAAYRNGWRPMNDAGLNLCRECHAALEDILAGAKASAR